MRTVVQDVSLFFGEEFQLIHNGIIGIENGAIAQVGERGAGPTSDETEISLNGTGLLAIPGLIDAHVHLGDSIVKDVGIGSCLNDLVHPIYGLKTRLLNEAERDEICQAIAATSNDMIASGITTFADFREGGLGGVQIALEALQRTRQRGLILGRPNGYFNENDVVIESKALTPDTINELLQTIDLCAGIGVSGPNEFTSMAMRQISELTKNKGKLLASHAAESAETRKFSLDSFSATEVERAIQHLKPDFMIHLTNSTKEDLLMLSEKHIPVVCCPRANSILGLGFPPIIELLDAGVTVALGTDNVMLNAPDMFREMDYTSRILRATHRQSNAIGSKEVFKMATINAARALRLDSSIGSLQRGKRADIVFLDLNSPNLQFSRDLMASVVHRARPEDIKCVMIDGEIVHGSIPSY